MTHEIYERLPGREERRKKYSEIDTMNSDRVIAAKMAMAAGYMPGLRDPFKPYKPKKG